MKRTYSQQKASSRGASRHGQDAPSKGGALLGRLLERVCRLMLLSIVFVVVGGIGYAGQQYVVGVIDRPVASVVVEGDFQFVSRNRVVDLLMPQISTSFLRLDLESIKQALETEAWIDRVALGRRWPDKLTVTITEQKPIARWGDGGFLNQRADVIAVEELSALSALPVLYAQEGNAQQAMAQYQDLAKLLRSRQLQLTALRCDEKQSWSVSLRSASGSKSLADDHGSVDLLVVIGRDQVMDKMRRFIQVYDRVLQPRLGDVISVDARYSNGLAVRWREGSERDTSSSV